MSWSLALNGVTDFLFTSFACSKENSFSLGSLPLNPLTKLRFVWLLFPLHTQLVDKKITSIKDVIFLLKMGRMMGLEPTNTGTTIRGLNHLATPAISLSTKASNEDNVATDFQLSEDIKSHAFTMF